MCIICTLSICACSKGVVEKIDTSGYEAEGINTDVYSIENFSFDVEGEEIFEKSYCHKDDGLYYATFNENEYDVNKQMIHVYRYDINKETNEVLFDIGCETEKKIIDRTVKCITVNESKDIIVYISKMYETDGTQVEKHIYSADGSSKDIKVIDCGAVSAVQLQCYDDKAENTYIASYDDEAFEVTYTRYDSEGQITGKVSFRTMMENSYMDKNGRLIVSVMEGENSKIGYIDFEANKLNEKEFGSCVDIAYSDILNEYGDVIYINEADSVSAYDRVSSEYLSLINLKKNNISGNELRYFSRLDDDKYICVIKPEAGEGTEEFLFLTKDENAVEKQNIIIAAINNNDTELTSYISAYNRSSNDINIEFRNYGIHSDEPYTDLLKDIMSGNSPDIFVVDNMNVDTLIVKGMLENLEDYMASDDTINEDYFIDGFLDATKIDGKQYVLMNNIQIDTLVGKNEDLNNYVDDWTPETLMDCYKSAKLGINLIDDVEKPEVFRTLFEANFSEYVDWKTTECRFTEGGLQKLLEFCGEIKCIEDNDALLHKSQIAVISDMQYTDILYGDDTAYVGYPSKEGGKTYIEGYGASFAMFAMSEHKEEAWEIIKELLTGDYNKYQINSQGIPVAKDEFEIMVQHVTATEVYTHEDGTTIYPQNIVMGDSGIKIGPATENDIEKLKNLIINASYKLKNTDIVDLISEDVISYFEGQKKADNVIDVIQDKVLKYVNENL